MKKALLPLLVGALLAGCGGSDGPDYGTNSNTGDGDGNGNGDITAVLLDTNPVMGADFSCDTDETGTTNNFGQFKVSDGAICDFSLDGYSIGSNTTPISSDNTVVTPFGLEQTASVMRMIKASGITAEQFAANISALLNSIDLNKSDDMIDTTSADGESLSSANPLSAISDEVFAAAMAEVKIKNTDGTTADLPEADIVLPSDAGNSLDDAYHSENLETALTDLKDTLEGDLTTVDIEAKLNEYRSLLETEDSSNGYQQDAAEAIFEILEIANSEEVANRFEITGSSYSEMLAKVLDLGVNPEATIKMIAESVTGTSDNEAALFADLAARLENAANKLGGAMPGEGYVLSYVDGDVMMNYQDSLVARAYALTLSNALYTLSAYNYGSDENYVLRDETIENVAIAVEVSNNDDDDTGGGPNTGSPAPEPTQPETGIKAYEDLDYIENRDVTTQTAPYLYNPKAALTEDQNILTFHSNADEQLTKAESSLMKATRIADEIDFSKYIDDSEIEYGEYDNPSRVAYFEDIIDQFNAYYAGDLDTIKIMTDGEFGYYTYLKPHALYNVETGLDRNDFDFSNAEYRCEFKREYAESDHVYEHDEEDYNLTYSYDEDTSKMINAPGCKHNESDIHNADNGDYDEHYHYFSSTKIAEYEEDGYWKEEFLGYRAMRAYLFVDLTLSANSNFSDIMWCTDKDGNALSCEE